MLIAQESNNIITPAHQYAYQSDFARILEDIDKGIIPCGSGQTFPIEFDNPADSIGNSGWGQSSNVVYNGGNIVNGFTFGLIR